MAENRAFDQLEAFEQDKILFDDINAAYDQAAMTLATLGTELQETEKKFGAAHKITMKRAEQLNVMRRLYDKSLRYINFLRDQNHGMYTEFMVAELIRHQKATGLPFQNIAQIIGWNPAQWARVDKWDETIKKFKETFGIPDELHDEFNDFIEHLRK